MRALLLGMVMFVLICYAPGVATTPSWGITNPNACPKEVDYTVTGELTCKVDWYVEVPIDAKVVVSLLNTTNGVTVLDFEEYFASANTRLEGSTFLHASVPKYHTIMELRVELKVLDHWGPGTEYYDVPVNVVPEFPAAALMLAVSLILVVTARRKIKRVGKGITARAPVLDWR